MKYGLMAVIVLLALPSCCMRKENGKPPRRARRMTERVPMEVTPMDQDMMMDETMVTEPMTEPMMTETTEAAMEATPTEADVEMVEEEIKE